MLSKNSILNCINKNEIIIVPFSNEFINEGFYELHLGNEFYSIKKSSKIIDPTDKSASHHKRVMLNKHFILKPHEFVIAKTQEMVGVSQKYAGRIDGKGSVAKVGLFIHVSSSHLNPGDNVQLTLELFNASTSNIKLTPGMKIAQIAFFKLV